jgi:6-pyruvoyltetrahydropterin/6-carboxytetrahydropterin synthase
MPYRVCKSFEIESGHMLSKHAGLCRFPHGHSRRVDVVLASDKLDAQDMVCDFKTLKLALGPFLARFDHAMLINSTDSMAAALAPMKERVIALEGVDPTTEVLAEKIFRFIESELCAGKMYRDEQGLEYRFGGGVRIERVRVTETSSSWAEFAPGV